MFVLRPGLRHDVPPLAAKNAKTAGSALSFRSRCRGIGNQKGSGETAYLQATADFNNLFDRTGTSNAVARGTWRTLTKLLTERVFVDFTL